MERNFKIALGLMLACSVFAVQAQDHTRDDLTSSVQVRVEKNPLYIPSSLLSDSNATSPSSSLLNPYGATISVPFKKEKVSFDLGLDFRFYNNRNEVDLKRNEGDTYNFNVDNLLTPGIYASALFKLPISGLTASVSGRHNGETTVAKSYIDYQARLSYQWKNGFGLQGGWQHQQISVDPVNDDSEVFRVESLFVDMKYKF